MTGAARCLRISICRLMPSLRLDCCGSDRGLGQVRRGFSFRCPFFSPSVAATGDCKRRLNERRRIVAGCLDDLGMPPPRQDSIGGLLFFDFGAFRPDKMLVFGRLATPANTMDTGERSGAGKPSKSRAVWSRLGRQNAQDRVLERWRAEADFGRWVGVVARVLSGDWNGDLNDGDDELPSRSVRRRWPTFDFRLEPSGQILRIFNTGEQGQTPATRADVLCQNVMPNASSTLRTTK